MFNPELAEKPYVVAYNKMDLPEAYDNWTSFKEKLLTRGIEPFCMSAVKREGTHEVIFAAYRLVQKVKEANVEGEILFLLPIILLYHSCTSVRNTYNVRHPFLISSLSRRSNVMHNF